MTSEILKIAEEIGDDGDSVRQEWAARLRAAVSPELLAFVAAAMAYCEREIGVGNRSKMVDAYRALRAMRGGA